MLHDLVNNSDAVFDSIDDVRNVSLTISSEKELIG